LGYQDFKAFGGVEGLKVHFETRHKNYQTPKEVPEDVLVGLGFTFINENSYDEALKILNSAIEYYPASYGAYNALGILYKKQNRLTKALISFEKALTLAKENSSPHLSYFRKQVETARSELKKS
jgi:Tfp pilus assembly protein PilF